MGLLHCPSMRSRISVSRNHFHASPLLMMPLKRFPPTPPPSAPTSQELKARAEAKLIFRAELAKDKPLAMQEYRAAEQAKRDTTARLRSERLAREREANRQFTTKIGSTSVSPGDKSRP